MPERAEELTQGLRLEPHPEGGAFREIFRSPLAVRPMDGRPDRAALTAIYFMLRSGEESRWHRVASDEAWVWLEGAPLELFVADHPGPAGARVLLGPVGEGISPVYVVPAGRWQAARSTGGYSLVTCMVGPGFDFADFVLDPVPPLP